MSQCNFFDKIILNLSPLLLLDQQVHVFVHHYQPFTEYLMFPIDCWIYNKSCVMMTLTFFGMSFRLASISLYFWFMPDSIRKINKCKTIITYCVFALKFSPFCWSFYPEDSWQFLKLFSQYDLSLPQNLYEMIFPLMFQISYSTTTQLFAIL